MRSLLAEAFRQSRRYANAKRGQRPQLHRVAWPTVNRFLVIYLKLTADG
ncbi:MAG: hypothetical protein F6K55_42160 [Moorea sp. SIO4A3]|nr:hypothetical protein [Moorena sp. SIO4A3]